MADGPRPGDPTPDDRSRVGQARLAAVVLAGAMVVWMAAQWLGGQFGWPTRFVFLFDLMAMAAFVWTMVVTWRLWRSRR